MILLLQLKELMLQGVKWVVPTVTQVVSGGVGV